MSSATRKLCTGNLLSPYSFITDRSLGFNYCTPNCLNRVRLEHAKNLYRKDLKGHFGCVNAIEFSHGSGEYLVSGGDDRRILLWQREKALDDFSLPAQMKGEHNSNIFCVSFDESNKKIFSGGNDEQVIVHDVETGETRDVFLHEDAVYGISVDPLHSDIFASACDDGRVLMYDVRAPSDEGSLCLANYTSPMHAVMFNPAEPRLLATANSREGLGLWDVRKPRSCLIRYGGTLCRQSCMSVRINRTGDKVLGLRRRLPPVIYNIDSSPTAYQFDHSGYYNSCTMKSCCFAGDQDQYIISGSDDFNLYVWKIPEDPFDDWVGEAHVVLHGHRSIVNQVRFNPSNHMIVSSGVEKVIKAWSLYPLKNGFGDLGLYAEAGDRQVFTHEQYLNLVLRSGQLMNHDYSLQSTDEDPRMMAFFDSLVQRELEEWSSEDSFSSSSPIHDSTVHSDTPVQSPTRVAVEHVTSAATNAVLSFFAPINAIANRTVASNFNGDNQVTTNRNEQETSRENNRVLFDMDRQDTTNESIDIASTMSGTISRVSADQLPSARSSTSVDVSVLAVNSDVSNAEVLQNIVCEYTNESQDNHDVPSTSDTNSDLNSRLACYRNISELIQQKRKDYLVGIQKLERRAISRKIKFLTRRKEKLKRIRERLLLGKEQYDSSDSESENEQVKPKIKIPRINSNNEEQSSSSTSSEDENDTKESRNLVQEITNDHKKRMNSLRHIKNLKNSLNSITVNGSRNELCETSKKTSPLSHSSSPAHNSQQIQGNSSNNFNVCIEPKDKQTLDSSSEVSANSLSKIETSNLDPLHFISGVCTTDSVPSVSLPIDYSRDIIPDNNVNEDPITVNQTSLTRSKMYLESSTLACDSNSIVPTGTTDHNTRSSFNNIKPSQSSHVNNESCNNVHACSNQTSNIYMQTVPSQRLTDLSTGASNFSSKEISKQSVSFKKSTQKPKSKKNYRRKDQS